MYSFPLYSLEQSSIIGNNFFKNFSFRNSSTEKLTNFLRHICCLVENITQEKHTYNKQSYISSLQLKIMYFNALYLHFHNTFISFRGNLTPSTRFGFEKHFGLWFFENTLLQRFTKVSNFIKKRLQHRCFSMNIVKCLRKLVL